MPVAIVPGIVKGIRYGIRTGINSGNHTWPSSAGEVQSAFGYGVWSSAWDCGEASGALTDRIGGITLSPTLTPDYRQDGIAPYDKAVGFTSGSVDRFTAASTATYNAVADTSIAMYACVRPLESLNRYMFGKGNLGAQYGIVLQSAPASIYAVVSDGVNTVLISVVNTFFDGNYHDILLVIDRVNQLAQVFTDKGNSVSTDISTIGSLSNASPLFIGASQNNATCAHRNTFTAIATSDIPNLRINGTQAITNIRRYTGRG